MTTTYSLLIGALLGGFILFLLTNFMLEGQQVYDVNMTMESSASIFDLNETLQASADAQKLMQQSGSQEDSGINLFKNAPSVVKKMVVATANQFSHVISMANYFGVPGWVVAIILSIVSLTLLFLILRAAFGWWT